MRGSTIPNTLWIRSRVRAQTTWRVFGKMLKIKQVCGTTAELFPSYLDEVQWRQMYGKKTVEAFNNILAQIAQFYPVNN